MINRRSFVLACAAMPAGCALGGRKPDPTGAAIRPPAVGQTWRYAKRNLFSGKLLDNQVDQVAALGEVVRIDSRSEAGAANVKKSWGKVWLEKYVGTDNPIGPLPSEIQQPWGSVLVDPHWSELQVYEKAIPLWPERLESGWSGRFNTEYKTPAHQGALAWDQSMT